MEPKELMEKYQELYSKMASGANIEKMKLFGHVMGDMMEELIATQPEKAAEYLERLEAVKWKNYLTHKEADKIVSSMEPQAPWGLEQWKQAMSQAGYELEEWPNYNRYALWTAMNMKMSDSGGTIQKYVNGSNLFKFVHELAIDSLKDRDEVFNIRKYFGV